MFETIGIIFAALLVVLVVALIVAAMVFVIKFAKWITLGCAANSLIKAITKFKKKK